jgi:hypothetical protein
MKTLLWLMTASIILLPQNSTGFLSSNPLTDEDRKLEAFDRKNGPAMTSAPDAPKYWESYNQWLCFPVKFLSVVRVGVTYEGVDKSIPQIDAERAGHLFQISLDGDIEVEFDKVAAEWQALIAESEEVCAYAAFLQELPNAGGLSSSLWVIQRLKGNSREWILDEEPTTASIDSESDNPNSTRQFGAYSVTISRSDDQMEGIIVISKDGKVVFEEKEIGTHYYFGNFTHKDTEEDSYSGLDINGNNIPDLVISKWTGGAHCCNFLYVFELGETFRQIVAIDGGSYGFTLADLNHDRIPEIEFSDGVIDYVFACFAGSPPGRVILKFTGDKYDIAQELMKTPRPTNHFINSEKDQIRLAFKKRDSPDLPYPFLKLMMDLSYTGHFDLALKVADETWPPDMPGLEKFKSDFREALDSSIYWKKLNAP